MISEDKLNKVYNILADSIDNVIPVNDYSESLLTHSDVDDAKFAAYIDLQGSFGGRLYILSSENALKTIFEKVFMFEWDDNEHHDIIVNSVCEFLNIVIANSTNILSEIDLSIEIGVPFPVEENHIKELFKEKLKCLNVDIGDGKLILFFDEKNNNNGDIN